MEDYIFFEGTLPSDYTLAYEESVFNLPSFNSLNNTRPYTSFYIFHKLRKKVFAGIHFCLDATVARSPFKAPFGSLEFSQQTGPGILYSFLEYVEQCLIARGVSEIFIKNPPRGYSDEKLSLLETFLLNQKYRILSAEVAAIIPVGKKPFRDIVRQSEKLRLQQAATAGFTFGQLPAERLDDVYRFISKHHKGKGYNLSITLTDLKETVAAFPQRYLLFVVLKGDEIIAATVSIRINENVFYNFLANHDGRYNSRSPLVFLMNGIYDFCRDHNIPLLDQGTSALGDKPNFSLLDFKIRLGGIPSAKATFYKKVD